jgi:hypothetical protein
VDVVEARIRRKQHSSWVRLRLDLMQALRNHAVVEYLVVCWAGCIVLKFGPKNRPEGAYQRCLSELLHVSKHSSHAATTLYIDEKVDGFSLLAHSV